MALSDEIKERLDIVDVVGSYVPTLQRAGRNYKAPCPFHSERTPSFVVFPERQSWRCFGACATGGDVLSFVMHMEKQGFADTLKLLAQRAGVTIPQRRDREERHAFHQVNEAAVTFFQEVMRSRQGIAARTYLQQRGVDTETIDQFQLGLSPAGGSTLLEHLSALGYPQEQVVGAGLATRAVDGSPQDLFRGRLTFPIRDDQGNLAGFGGRSLDGSEPKYLNSPHTQVFDKGRILYAFHRAKAPIKEQGEGVVVEGYMDAIAAHQHGFRNVVASMGTALTEPQVALLRGVGRTFVLALDPDAAGQAATFRSLETSWRVFERRAVGRRRNVPLYERRADLSLKIAVLPFGKDPDKVIHENPEEWRRLVDEALPLLDYLFTSAAGRWDLSTSEGKAKAGEELYPLIATLDNVFEQERYFRQLADTLGVQPATLEASLGRLSHSVSRRAEALPAPRASVSVLEQERRDPLEEHLLALILQWPDLREYLGELDAQVLKQWEDREVFTSWIRCSTIEALLQTLDDDLRQRVHDLLTLPIPPLDPRQREQAAEDCVRRLEERRLRSLKAEEALLLGQWEQPGQTEQIEQRIVDTNEQLRRLFHARTGPERHG